MPQPFEYAEQLDLEDGLEPIMGPGYECARYLRADTGATELGASSGKGLRRGLRVRSAGYAAPRMSSRANDLIALDKEEATAALEALEDGHNLTSSDQWLIQRLRHFLGKESDFDERG